MIYVVASVQHTYSSVPAIVAAPQPQPSSMAPTPNGPPPPPPSSPLCASCPNPSTIPCPNCHNTAYRSLPCRQTNSPQHTPLCSALVHESPRPSPQHYRAILFPADEPHPRFIWLLVDGARGYHNRNTEITKSSPAPHLLTLIRTHFKFNNFHFIQFHSIYSTPSSPLPCPRSPPSL